MKRTFAVVVLLTALGVLIKLAVKDGRPAGPTRPDIPAAGPTATAIDPDAELLVRYPDDRERVGRILRKYGHTARQVERTDGLRGLTLLEKLDLEAIFLYERHPEDFRRLRDSLTDAAAADLLLHWQSYFGTKRADDTDREVLIAEIGRLAPSQRRSASKYPNALPLILAEPVGVTELIERLDGEPKDLADALVILDFISLEHGASDLRAALRTLEDHPTLALDAFRLMGPDGFALVVLYGPVLEALGDALPLEQALIALRVNTDDLDDLLHTRQAETVAAQLRHVAAVGLIEAVGGHPHALRLTFEYGEVGERALAQAGPDAADVVFEDYSDPSLRTQAVAALAEHGPMALAILDKYAPDPDFRDVLRRHGPAVIPPIARADTAPETLTYLESKKKKSFTESVAQGLLAVSGENGQGTIRTIKADGLARVKALESAEVHYYQFLPLYDLLHLGGVVGRGQAPTSGEMAWALVDGCFVVADILSLTALQPEGAAAAEAARAELKAATREAAQAAGRSLTRRGAETATERASKWWAVRLAGGPYKLLRRLPEALRRLALPEIAEMARPLCAKAGLRLSTWDLLRKIPPGRGLKYVAAQAVQASVGVVAVHKMEEHLASRRPQAQP